MLISPASCGLRAGDSEGKACLLIEEGRRMKTGFTFNQIAVTALIVAGAIAVATIVTGHSGLVELRCGSEGCQMVIDGRSE